MNSTLSKVIGVLVLVVLVVLAVKLVKNNDQPENRIANAIENAGDDIRDAGEDVKNDINKATN